MNPFEWLSRDTFMIKLLCVFVTITAASMTSAAAWDRGGTLIDKVLLVALSAVIVLAVHLLPALSRRPVVWLVWAGCLFCATFGHLTFLTHASLRAGDERAQQSALTMGTERQIDMTREALLQISARPVATVAAVLAMASDRRERAALRAEIAEGKRAEVLQDDLVRLSGVSTEAQVSGADDPVISRISAVTGYSESAVFVVVGMTFSILIELVGALLWVEALRPSEATIITGNHGINIKERIESAVTAAVTDPVTTLRMAIEAGQCRETVAGIRAFLKCSQARAMKLRRKVNDLRQSRGLIG